MVNTGMLGWTKYTFALYHDVYAYDSQRLINPDRIETNQFCGERPGMLWVCGGQSYYKLENNQFRLNSTRPSLFITRSPSFGFNVLSSLCPVFSVVFIEYASL